jgi:hypothetical protein
MTCWRTCCPLGGCAASPGWSNARCPTSGSRPPPTATGPSQPGHPPKPSSSDQPCHYQTPNATALCVGSVWTGRWCLAGAICCGCCAAMSATTTSSDRTAAWPWRFPRRGSGSHRRWTLERSGVAMCLAALSTSITRSQHDESGFPRPTGLLAATIGLAGPTSPCPSPQSLFPQVSSPEVDVLA